MEFEKHTGIFSTSGDVASAFSTGAINKPYMAIVGNELDWNSQGGPPDYTQMYLTIEALETGDFTVNPFSFDVYVYYSINEGPWFGGTGTAYLSLSTGDKVRFKSDNQEYSPNMFAWNSISFKIYGNIESMEYGDDFISKTALRTSTPFAGYFQSCQNLVSVENLILPATELGDSCYGEMFKDCTNLIDSPMLPAKTLKNYCYQYMFSGDESLKSIRCLATDVSAQNCCMNWVDGTSASGTFYKDPDMNDWPTGANGIPSGWTVVDYTPPV